MGVPAPPDLLEGRLVWEAHMLSEPLPADAAVHAVVLGGVPCERVMMAADGPGLVLLLHGGGYTSGSPRTHRRLAAHLSAAAGCPVVVPDYRLAPEHPFPAGLEDAAAAWAALGGPAALAGDSAGGGLAAALLLLLRERGLPGPVACGLMSPWADLVVGRGASYAENRHLDAETTREELEACAAHYLAGADPRDPLASPVEGDLSGLPPLLVQCGAVELLRDDGVRLAGRAREAGVDARCEVWPGLGHAWHLGVPGEAAARAAVAGLGAFLAGHLR